MNKSRLMIALAVFVFSLALVSVSLAAASRNAAILASQPILPDPGNLPEGDGPWVVRAYYDDPQMVARLASRLEPWEVNRDKAYLVVEVNRELYLWLQWLGFRVQVDEKMTAQLNQPHVMAPGQVSGIPGFPCYRTVEETYARAAQIAVDYPSLAAWIDVYDSWEKIQSGGLPGYDLRVLRLTNSGIPGPKPKLFVMSAMHAREYATAELNLRFAEHLVENYGLDPDVTWLLDYHEIHLLLQSNPDGRKKAETGISWRKNTDNDDGCAESTKWGTDLNRNFDFQWGCCDGSSSAACDETYRGPAAGSEPETQAVQNYVLAEYPDQRPDDLTTPAPIDATGLFLDLHSYSRLVLWPWGFTSSVPPNGTQLQTLGRKFAYFNNYEPDQAINLYPTDGTTDDFAYGELGLASYTFELGTSFFQDCASFENTILPDNLEALLYAAKSAGAPYMTPDGPDVLDVAVLPAAVTPGEPAVLTAVADDTRFNNQNGSEPTQNISAAEYYIDVPPWSTSPPPVAHSMLPSDGVFNAKIEAVQATVDTSSLRLGRHMIYVRGRDTDGNWGPVSAVFLYVLEPDTAPLIEGYVRDYSNNSPLGAAVSAGAFEANTNMGNGFYSMLVISGTYDMSAKAPDYMTSTVHDIAAHDGSLVQQNFYLQPVCTIFSDDVDFGENGWTKQLPWGITDEDYHSPTYSWTDSPGVPYGNNADFSITSPVFNLSDVYGVNLSFWHKYITEKDWDFGRVEYSTNGGYTWSQAASYTGYDDIWNEEIIPLPLLDGQASARLRFRFTSDQSGTEQGWHIDDIRLYGSGSSCYTSLAPTADFTSNSPVLPGERVRFTDQTPGTHPLSYFWDFGDGTGNSTLSDPYYTYAASGTYQVTLTVTNDQGSDSVIYPVVVFPCTPISAVSLTQKTPSPLLLGEPVQFQADIEPDNAYKPYSYAVDYGDGTSDSGTSSDDPLLLSHNFNLPGEFPILFSAWNCSMEEPKPDTTLVNIYAEDAITISPASDAATIPPGEVVTYTLRVTNTGPSSSAYNLELSDHFWDTQLSPTTLGPLEPGQGQDFNVRVEVPENAAGSQSDTVNATVSAQSPGILPVSAQLTTTAANIYAFSFQPEEISQIGLPGSTVTYITVLSNTGNISDTYTITIDSVKNWPFVFTVIPQEYINGGSITLDRGRSATLQAVLSIPEDTASGDYDTLTITATSSGPLQLSRQARMETIANAYTIHMPFIPAQ